MTGKKIAFVSDRESFIIKSIMKNLTAKGHTCTFAPIKVGCLESIKDEISGGICLYIDDLNAFDRTGGIYLRDLCVDKDCALYLMGHEKDIEKLKEDIFIDGATEEFYRPINAGEVAEVIDATFAEAGSKRNRKHVLVVDDSGTMLTTIKGWLQGKYRVTILNSAMNALTFLATQRPDLILLDYEMPVCTGAQFLEMMRTNPATSDIPVIFLTGKDDAETVRKVLALKPLGYMLKSLPREEIVGRVDAFFRNYNS